MAVKRAKFRVEEITEEKPEEVVPPQVSDPEPEAPEPKVVTEEIKEEVPVEETPKIETPSENKDDEIKDWLKDVKPDVSKEIEKGSSLNLKVVFGTILTVLIIGAVVGGFYYYKKGMTSTNEPETPQPLPVTVVPSNEVTPTTAPVTEVNKKDLKLEVLNGSGKVGEAGVVKTLLTKAGFTDSNITTGNASSYDFTNTEVSLKKGTSQSVYEAVKTALGDKYTVSAGKELPDSSKVDISVVVGKSK